MAICPKCKFSFREPEDEQGDHDCPKCRFLRASFIFEGTEIEIIDKRKDGDKDVR